MSHAFPELVIGGILLAPFAAYLAMALAVIIVLRPLLHVLGFAKLFSHAPVAELSLYVSVLGLLMLLF